MIQYRLTSECYIIDMETEHENFIAYFPLKSLVLKVNSEAANLITSMKEKPIMKVNNREKQFLQYLITLKLVNNSEDIIPDSPTCETPQPVDVLLLTTDRCNLRCVYCYGNSDSSGDDMKIEIGKVAIDTIIENSSKLRKGYIGVGFHGGGEPSLNWDVLVDTIEYAQERCKVGNIKLHSEICTNGVLTEEKVTWLANHIDNIVVSIDGSPEIQNAQRPFAGGAASFEYVAKTIDILDSIGKHYGFRVTATALSSSGLTDIYKFLTTRFHPIAVCIEPLFVCGRCFYSHFESPTYEIFTKNLIEIFDKTLHSDVPVQYSGGRLYSLGTSFCGSAGNNFFVTPRGEVTACLEVFRGQDPRAEMFMYGKYDTYTKRFVFNLEKFQRLARMRVKEFDSCKDCFAKWHCCGDCLAKSPDLLNIGTVKNAYRCTINRAYIKHQLRAGLEYIDR